MIRCVESRDKGLRDNNNVTTSISLSGPDASKLYTCAICLRNGVVSVVFAESYTVTLPPNEDDPVTRNMMHL